MLISTFADYATGRDQATQYVLRLSFTLLPEFWVESAHAGSFAGSDFAVGTAAVCNHSPVLIAIPTLWSSRVRLLARPEQVMLFSAGRRVGKEWMVLAEHGRRCKIARSSVTALRSVRAGLQTRNARCAKRSRRICAPPIGDGRSEERAWRSLLLRHQPLCSSVILGKGLSTAFSAPNDTGEQVVDHDKEEDQSHDALYSENDEPKDGSAKGRQIVRT